jgi:hypothetical protein
MLLNQNWKDADGKPDGGVSIGEGFTIAWQRGALDKNGRNGAFLIEVLEAVQGAIGRQQISSGIGFTIVAFNADTIPQALAACIHQLELHQKSEFACEENEKAIVAIKSAKWCIKFASRDVQKFISNAIAILKSRADRRAKDGTVPNGLLPENMVYNVEFVLLAAKAFQIFPWEEPYAEFLDKIVHLSGAYWLNQFDAEELQELISQVESHEADEDKQNRLYEWHESALIAESKVLDIVPEC